jgi:hypothetical protein
MRKLTPELLDHLPHDDPGAICSRRDLRRINLFMGNESWVAAVIPKSARSITEIGAGDGHLLSRLVREHPQADIIAYDLAPRPADLPTAVKWIQGDLFAQPPPPPGGVLIANLFLHHFTDPQLSELGKWMSTFDAIIINEPLRATLPLLMGKLAWPFIHPITRHDMRVSIEAGFRLGELPAALGLERIGYRIQESSSQRGFIRMVAEK